uniref:Truncated env protein n=1 Tax=Human immunodeficiency virus type 1 TaxID=11676 RepID=B5AD23_HV1|nr:truncated env protein [Human immunodeficiency virus 1]
MRVIKIQKNCQHLLK